MKYSKRNVIPINEANLLTVLNKMDVTENRKVYRDLLIIELMYLTGCRVGELINIKKAGIDFSSKRIKVNGKGNKERYLILTDNVIHRIKRNSTLWKGKNKIHDLLCDNRGKQLYSMFVDRLIKKYFKPSSEYQRSAHIIRHSMATHLFNSGVKIKDIQQLLGHVFLSTTANYIYIDKEVLLKIYSASHSKA